MNTYKNTEIADEFNVSNTTVSRWVEAAQNKKNNLQLYKKRGKLLIIDNQNNKAELARLAEDGKKYRVSSNLKRVIISNEFYNVFTEEEIAELMSDIEFKRQMKTKYSYKNANYWDIFYKDSQSPVVSVVGQLLQDLDREIDHFLVDTKFINIIDIGPGNVTPIRDLIKKYHDNNLLSKYVAIDISDQINTLAKNNIHDWFPDIEVITYQRDVEATRLGKILLENKSFDRNITNVIFHLGGTLDNHDDRVLVLKNLKNGMIDNDILIFNFSLETDFHKSNLNYVRASIGDKMQSWPLELMGIDIDDCEISMEYDSKMKCKAKIVTLDKNYILEFNLFGNSREIELHSGEKVNIWRHYLISLEVLISELKQSGLELSFLKLDPKLNSAIAICKVALNQ